MISHNSRLSNSFGLQMNLIYTFNDSFVSGPKKVVGAKLMVLKYINWWQSQAYMGHHKEQIICAAR